MKTKTLLLTVGKLVTVRLNNYGDCTGRGIITEVSKSPDQKRPCMDQIYVKGERFENWFYRDEIVVY